MIFRSKNKNFEEALQRQREVISEKEELLKTMQQRLYYAEGQLKVYQDMVEVLRKQLQEEMQRTSQLQNTFILQQNTNPERFIEQFNKLYEEDETEIKDLQDQIAVEGEL